MSGKLIALLEIAMIYLLVLMTPMIFFNHFGGRLFTIICYLTFLAIVVVFLVAMKKDLTSYGITLHNLGMDLKIVAICIIPVNAVLLSGILLPLPNLGTSGNMLLRSAISILMLFVIGKLLASVSFKTRPTLVQKVTLSSLVILPTILLLSMAGFTTLATPLLYTFILYFVFVGPVEELVYRGYIQSRLNEAFGRPYRFFGISLGAGLIITSLLFGFAHVLNYNFNPLAGNYSLDWQWGFDAFLLGLAMGIIREKAGSIVAPAILHASFNFGPYLSGL